ncbi:hypothetical protein POM88_023066 [Heracleum sosnowskyi]|uniref:Uncharacterized protein n=1 Tax=Heracleum sosnowskyi TaxID=360622 RepID=A0AAD8II15_9APIA|nr:hypothetical protein POM88_023066 [Heracleum sosnowskyi]
MHYPLSVRSGMQVEISYLRLASGEWNKDILDLIFAKEDVERILAIPVGSLNNDDEIIWFPSKDGQYSVRSGYRKAIKVCDFPESSNSKNISEWWKFLCVETESKTGLHNYSEGEQQRSKAAGSRAGYLRSDHPSAMTYDNRQ